LVVKGSAANYVMKKDNLMILVDLSSIKNGMKQERSLNIDTVPQE
jgi:hypothetical protein